MGSPPPNEGNRRYSRVLASLRPCGIPLFALLIAGCANPAAPKPPSLHLPELPQHLTADRAGDRVALRWTTSADATDGGTLKGPVSARVCREDVPQSATALKPAVCEPVARMSVQPGATRVQLALPAALLTGPPRPIAFRVELLNTNEHSAGPSQPAFALAGAAPPAPGPLRTAAVRNAVEITWSAQPAPAAEIELHRTLVATATGPYVALPARSRTPDSPPYSASQRATSGPALTQPDAILRPDPLRSPGGPRDPGGLIDRTVHPGDTLTYTARRYLTVPTPGLARLAATPATNPPDNRHRHGKADEAAALPTALVLYSEVSPPSTFTFRDTVPPAAPGGLEAVPGGGFGAPPSVDLSWSPSVEADLAGYNVYRAEVPNPGGTPHFIRLNPELLPGPGFHDATATPGKHYLYRVTALDQRGNESEPGPALTVITANP